MSIIDRRVQEKGHVLDEHAPLLFKAYLTARKDDPVTKSRENLYAPFYVWRDTDGMRDFVSSTGFVGLAQSFGWPQVLTWPAVVSLQVVEALSGAKFASKEVVGIAPFADLQQLRRAERELSRVTIEENHALLAFSAFEPDGWTLVRLRMYSTTPPATNAMTSQTYDVLHVSIPTSG
jgi:hypothetical protein